MFLFCFISFFWCIIAMSSVFLMVIKRCVMITVVLFVMMFFSVFCIMCFDLVFSVFVVLLSSSIFGFFSMVLVIVSFCFWLLDSVVLCLFIIVLSFCKKDISIW